MTDTDEEMVAHPFNSRTPYEAGDDRDIWCKDCEYHRDHLIHLTRCSECGQTKPAHSRDDIGTCERFK